MSLDSVEKLVFPKTPYYDEVLNLVLNNTQKGIVFTNERNAFIYVNKTFTDITGYSFEEVKGKTPNVLPSSILPSNFYEEMKREVLENSYWNGTLWTRTKNGEIYLQELEMYAFRN